MILSNRFRLRRNFQRISTNRFVVDSKRFWQPTFHPRFAQIFSTDDFENILKKANLMLSFPFSDEYLQIFAEQLFNYLSPFRFALIPAKNPNYRESFLADLFFILRDILPRLNMQMKPLIEDDFNVVSNKADSGKDDFTKLYQGEKADSKNGQETHLDILTNTRNRVQNTATTDNIDEETETNNKSSADNFLSPQDMGVSPNPNNVKHEGVDGVELTNDANFTTNTQTGIFGESVKSKTNETTQGQLGEQEIIENNDARTLHHNEQGQNMESGNELTNRKTDHYTEQLNYDKAQKMQEYYNIMIENLWYEILGKLNRWVLQVNIAISSEHYLDCEVFD